MVNSYTTQNDYVKNSREIFSSDTRFKEDFNKFINKLINKDEHKMIFLFIDDIDLSTNRSIDVVKTLLSFIAHPRIITFISGDMKNFEEALMLDFLRMEGLLNIDLFNGHYTDQQEAKTNVNSLFNSKKNLAFEYLKKIIPPVYRHNVKMWSIFERGNFLIADESTPLNQTLAQLLNDLFANDVFNCYAYFKYYDIDNNQERNIPETFHIFDDTSRGLNNVYNALLNEQDILKKYITSGDDKENHATKAFVAIKLILETIVNSNPKLNLYREDLFSKIIYFGTDFKSSYIRFDNLRAAITKKNDGTSGSWSLINIVDRFRLFILVDLAARLLQVDLQNDDYKVLKDKINLEIISNPIISDDLTVIDNKISVDSYFNGNNGKLLLLNVLIKSDFVFVLNYIQFQSIAKINNSIPKSNYKDKDCNDYDNKLYVDAYNSYKSIEHFTGTEYIYVFAENTITELNKIRCGTNQTKANICRVLYDHLLEDIYKTHAKANQGQLPLEYYFNTMELNLGGIFNENKIKSFSNELIEEYADDEILRGLCELGRDVTATNKWESEFISCMVIDHIQKKIKPLLNKLFKVGEREILILLEQMQEQLKKFKEAYKGVSETAAKKADKQAKANNLYADKFNSKIDYDKLGNALFDNTNSFFKLSNNTKVAYGRVEAEQIIQASDNLTLDIQELEIDEKKRLELYLIFYAHYYIVKNKLVDISIESDKIAQLNDITNKNRLRYVKESSQKAYDADLVDKYGHLFGINPEEGAQDAK